MTQAIVGSWYIGNIEDLGSTDQIVFTFLEDGTFLVADKGTTDADGTSGLEYGTYSWNETSGALTMTYSVNTDGGWGTSSAGITSATVSGDTLTFFGTDTPPEGFVVPRLISAVDSIVGSWLFVEDGDRMVFTFLPDGTYLLADKGNSVTDPDGTDGIEQGTYSWNASTGVLTWVTLVNTDGEWGLSHAHQDVKSFHLVAGSLVIEVDGGANTITGTRLSPLPAAPDATSGPDILSGTASNDTINALGGDDTIDGLAGIDASVYSGLRSGHTITKTATGFTVADTAGDDGTDTLSGIERLQFSDIRVALDVDGNAGTVAKILGAVFGAESVHDHPDYMGIGLSLLDGGMSYATLMQLAIGVRLGVAAADNSAVVDLLYTNVVGSHPGAAEQALFVGLLDSGNFTAGTLGVLAADTAINQSNIDLAGLAQTGIDYL
jgi:hypothetical protein